MRFFVLFALGLALAFAEDAPPPIVETPLGGLRGFRSRLEPENGSEESADVFLGIPFALPPIGALRFEVWRSPPLVAQITIICSRRWPSINHGRGCAMRQHLAPAVCRSAMSATCRLTKIVSRSTSSGQPPRYSKSGARRAARAATVFRRATANCGPHFSTFTEVCRLKTWLSIIGHCLQSLAKQIAQIKSLKTWRHNDLFRKI